MNQVIRLLLLFFLISTPVSAAQKSYKVQQLSKNFFAALAIPGGQSSTNAFFFMNGNQVIAGGAHMTKGAIDDLWSAIVTTVHKPVQYFILTHHHPGFSQIDTVFPADVTLVLSGDTWKSLNKEGVKTDNPILLFSDGLTFKTPLLPTLVLSNIGPAHTDGDTIVVIPDENIAYVGDLLYIKSVGYMSDGHMRSWLQFLDFLSGLELKQIIPGYGTPVDKEGIDEFRIFFRDFLSEVLTGIERNESAATMKKKFSLPKYLEWSGYKQFLQDNAEHAWYDLQDDFPDEESKN